MGKFTGVGVVWDFFDEQRRSKNITGADINTRKPTKEIEPDSDLDEVIALFMVLAIVLGIVFVIRCYCRSKNNVNKRRDIESIDNIEMSIVQTYGTNDTFSTTSLCDVVNRQDENSCKNDSEDEDEDVSKDVVKDETSFIGGMR